jgi:hypothetical protein
MKSARSLAGILAAVAVLSACARSEPNLVNLRSATADEFAVMPARPLDMPDSLAQLPMPVPGGPNRADRDPRAEGIAALGGRAGGAGGIPQADAALLVTAQRYGITPQIRAVLAAEDIDWRRTNRGRLLDRWLNKTTYFAAYRPLSLNPRAEEARFRALGVRTPSSPPAADGG